jgi:hypothetical protein
VAILAADAPEFRLGLRVAGDLLDGGLLAARAAVQPEARPRARGGAGGGARGYRLLAQGLQPPAAFAAPRP